MAFPYLLPTPRSLDRNYMTMVLSSTLALVCMLISAYTCKFARVVEVKTSTQHAIFTEAVAVPTAIGIWRVEGFVVAATEHEKNHNLQSCVAWDHTLWEQNGSIRASKFYAIASTVLGCLLWGLILFGSCHKINGNMLFCLCTLCLMCEALSALLFEVLGAQTCFHYGHQCGWDFGAWMGAAAVILWMSTAIGLAMYRPNHGRVAVAPINPPTTDENSSPQIIVVNSTANDAADAETLPSRINFENGQVGPSLDIEAHTI